MADTSQRLKSLDEEREAKVKARVLKSLANPMSARRIIPERVLPNFNNGERKKFSEILPKLIKFFTDYVPGNPIYLVSRNTSLHDRLLGLKDWYGFSETEFTQDNIDRIRREEIQLINGGATTSDMISNCRVLVASREILYDTPERDLAMQGAFYILRTNLTEDRSVDLKSIRARRNGSSLFTFHKSATEFVLGDLADPDSSFGAHLAAGATKEEVKNLYDSIGLVKILYGHISDSDYKDLAVRKLFGEAGNKVREILANAGKNSSDLERILHINMNRKLERKLSNGVVGSIDLTVDGIMASHKKLNEITRAVTISQDHATLVTLENIDFNYDTSESIGTYKSRVVLELSAFAAKLMLDYGLELLPRDFREYALDRASMFRNDVQDLARLYSSNHF